MKALLKKIIPERLILSYHFWMAKYAARKFKHPSNKLIVIGVTGTKGKSTTCNIIWHILTQLGYKVGMATTANFRIGDKHWLNDTKMTMLGRTQLQKLLSDMVEAGCQYAIVETSSEGVKQSRHIGINYDIGVFTNLFPEHLDAHGGFENYKQAKLDFFTHISQSELKQDNGRSIQKMAIINGNSKYATEFFQTAKVGTHVVWTRQSDSTAEEADVLPINIRITDPRETKDGVAFSIGEYNYTSPLLGDWNIDNIMAALSVAVSQGASYPELIQPVATIPPVPGRMETINVGQPFKVIVDYAYEPKSLALLYEFARKQVGDDHNLITLISSTGGGRDVWRRAANGKVAVEHCNYVIVTDEDPYDEDPMEIINEVARGALEAGAVEGENMWRVPQRFHAIQQAMKLAQPGDVVFLTAKGSEQKMCLAKGKKIDWDDRAAAKEALKQLGYGK